MKVREATVSDFDNIYELLKRLNNSSITREDWRSITNVNFETDKSYGYVLENSEQNEILGFIGTIFSKQKMKDQELSFCNFHSWIVDPKAKSGGMLLLLKVIKQKDVIVTNFTASEVPYKIFKSLKFKEIDYKNYKLFPSQSLKFKKRVVIHKITDNNADSYLTPQELKLYNDHKNFNNVHFLMLQHNEQKVFVICKKKPYVPNKLSRFRFLNKKIFLGEIHYVSNPNLFFSIFSNSFAALKICSKLGVVGLLSSDRFIPEFVKINKKIYPSKRPFMYKNTDDENLINTLYSEFFVLNF